MNIEQLAYAIGQRLAKTAEDEPFLDRLGQHSLAVSALGSALLGGAELRRMHKTPRMFSPENLRALETRLVSGAVLGGGLGLATGTLHGGADAARRFFHSRSEE